MASITDYGEGIQAFLKAFSMKGVLTAVGFIV